MARRAPVPAVPALAALLLAGLALAGCGSLIDTPFEQPAVTVPTAWRAPVPDSSAAATAPGLDRWWLAFGDPTLNALEAEALARNNDLAAATIAVRRALLEAGLAADAYLPHLDAGPDVTRSTELSGSRTTTNSFSVGASVSYEVDLWGRLGSNLDAARWAALASEQDRQATALTLVGTTATLYWNLLFLKERIALAQASIAYAEQTLALARTRLDAGAASPLDVLEAQRSLEAQRATLSDFEQQLFETQSALTILFDGPPEALAVEQATLPRGPLPEVEAGLPVELIGRRPDVRAAQLRLREDLADVDATRASYFPTLSLTGSLGSSSIALKDLLSNPIGTLGAGLVLPFLNFNQMQLDVAVSKTQYQSDVTTYRQTLYQALSDVENALSNRRNLAIQQQHLQATLDAARGAEQLHETRYREGAEQLQDWIDAQENRRTAEENLLQNRLDQLDNQVTLYQALGGGTGLAPAEDLTVPTTEASAAPAQ
ncbi:efflux transporter, outer membrane factor (OMF) lipoprotein, NodT family [Tistlia consotensis]|uniref:Efflux transporter, outer membrane factor (OMF) lipoprotein, NodT family n=1 Tax=Tistlia consotensis USBA 355 TaxID=560819 RepID=A0A1Y6BIU6_9PROT|nr:efflux transporter outer membrane subunit [Tistlia consotensis]SMF05327.1 efflux transporter, outer membrane factor (OMF) lipoprotein, NodT family [Tistlia consotensis USBA 355]SNR55247.1 efflux transporter, outer membrane factor (OMF) lipoprotein, NodT family [Tistlia consotensis]